MLLSFREFEFDTLMFDRISLNEPLNCIVFHVRKSIGVGELTLLLRFESRLTACKLFQEMKRAFKDNLDGLDFPDVPCEWDTVLYEDINRLTPCFSVRGDILFDIVHFPNDL